VRLAVAATPGVAIPTLEALLESDHELVRIFTRSDAVTGRGQIMRESEVAGWARVHEIEVVKTASANDLGGHLKDLDCVLTIAYGFILPLQFICSPRYGFINLHFSSLPQWRGAAPVQRAIEAGDDYLGVTVFALDAGMDTGPIYVNEKVLRNPLWRTSEALTELATVGSKAVLTTLDLIENGTIPLPQSDHGVSRAAKLHKDEAVIDWSQPAAQLRNKIAAFYPNPIAFTIFRGAPLKLVSCALAADLELKPGELHLSKAGLFIGTGEGVIESQRVIPAGKGEMIGADWARGIQLIQGDLCG
jgi:methionyl-tRNA formyltransferase